MLSMISEALLRLQARFEREEGQGLAEYGLILALVSIAAIVALGIIAVAISGMFGDVTAALGGGI